MARSPSTGETGSLPLSVVLACPEGAAADGALRALERATRGVATELLVARPSSGHPAGGTGRGPRVRRVEGPPGALVPELWAAGFRAARGDAVAFTTAHLRVSEDWASALLAALGTGAAGAGGPIRLAPGAGALERAVHLLRYAAHAGPRPPGPVEEVPGDNAAYRREVLERERDLLIEGFWDVEVHRRLRGRGEELAWVPAAEASMVATERLGVFLRQRFRHGTRFGRYRTRELGRPVWRSLAAAPLVPAVLAGRALARRPAREWAGSLHALPYLLLTAAAWAVGEARGACGAGVGRNYGGEEPG